LSKDFFTPNNISEYTTLVIAGYGSFDKFPKYIGLRIFGVIGGYVLTNHYKKNEVTHESPSCVAAFAQRDVVKNIWKE
jgi:peptidoglycan/LPS O-acetylase OafA/YrhL